MLGRCGARTYWPRHSCERKSADRGNAGSRLKVSRLELGAKGPCVPSDGVPWCVAHSPRRGMSIDLLCQRGGENRLDFPCQSRHSLSVGRDYTSCSHAMRWATRRTVVPRTYAPPGRRGPKPDRNTLATVACTTAPGEADDGVGETMQQTDKRIANYTVNSPRNRCGDNQGATGRARASIQAP